MDKEKKKWKFCYLSKANNKNSSNPEADGLGPFFECTKISSHYFCYFGWRPSFWKKKKSGFTHSLQSE